MTWELLTKNKFFGADAVMNTLIDAHTGATPLASEQDLAPEVHKGLGNRVYRDTVLQMLSRDPAMRPDMSELVRKWTSVFQENTMTPGPA
jgi:hypothetical protein